MLFPHNYIFDSLLSSNLYSNLYLWNKNVNMLMVMQSGC